MINKCRNKLYLQGEARHGEAWRGMAWRGKAWRGKARQGFYFIVKDKTKMINIEKLMDWAYLQGKNDVSEKCYARDKKPILKEAQADYGDTINGTC